MVSLITGVLFVAFCVVSLLPGGPLHWGSETVQFIKGSLPVFAFFVGMICLFIGAADIKDKNEAAREERKAQEASQKTSNEKANP